MWRDKFTVLFTVLIMFIEVDLVFSLNKEKDCECEMKISKNIINGRISESLPWVASLTILKEPPQSEVNEKFKIEDHECNAVVLNEHWVMTTKSCAKNKKLTYLVGFGTDKVKMFDEKKIEVKRIEHYPDDPADMHEHNISLLELEKPISFDENIRPACIDTQQYKKRKSKIDTLLTAGFGMVVPFKRDRKTRKVTHLGNELYTRYLKENDMKDVSDEDPKCKKDKTLLCAKSKNPNEGPSIGDGGGPLHYTFNGKTFVVGVSTSIGGHDFDDDPNYDYHGVENNDVWYKRTAFYSDWIEKTLGINNYCDDRNVDKKRQNSEEVLNDRPEKKLKD